jgi:hypothetical protein
MLDVHAPHKPLRGISEILIHLITITLGLLIATQIEGCMEWRGHVHLAAEARDSLRAEIQHNLQDLRDTEPGLKTWRGEIDHDLEAMQRIQDHPEDPAAQKASVVLNFHAMSLRDTAWKTAQNTGALAYMPYAEAERYAEIYQDQSRFLEMEEKPEGDVSVMLGMIDRFRWNDTTKITKEQASEMAGKLGEMKLHLITGDLLLQETIEASDAFLQNRTPREDFEEHWH